MRVSFSRRSFTVAGLFLLWFTTRISAQDVSQQAPGLVFDAGELSIPAFKKAALGAKQGAESARAIAAFVGANCPTYEVNDLSKALTVTASLGTRQQFCLFPALYAAVKIRTDHIRTLVPEDTTSPEVPLEIRLRSGLIASPGRATPRTADMQRVVEYLFLRRALSLSLEHVHKQLRAWYARDSASGFRTVLPQGTVYVSSGVPLSDLATFAASVSCSDRDLACPPALQMVAFATTQATTLVATVATELAKPLQTRRPFPATPMGAIRATFALDQQLLTLLRNESSASVIAATIVGSTSPGPTTTGLRTYLTAYSQLLDTYPRSMRARARNDLYAAVVVASELTALKSARPQPNAQAPSSTRDTQELAHFIREALGKIASAAHQVQTYALLGLPSTPAGSQ